MYIITKSWARPHSFYQESHQEVGDHLLKFTLLHTKQYIQTMYYLYGALSIFAIFLLLSALYQET